MARPPSPSLLAQYQQAQGYEPAGAASLREASRWMSPLPPASRLVFPDLMQRRLERSTDPALERQGQQSLENLLGLCRDFERKGRGQECSQLQPSRRLRGLDLLYGAKEAAPNVKEEKAPPVAAHRPRRMSRRRSSRALAERNAAQVLGSVPFFQKFDAQYPGLVSQLAANVAFSSEREGQVLFRQGDPPAACYVLARGEVGVFIAEPLSRAEVAAGEKQPEPTPRKRHDPAKLQTLTSSMSRTGRRPSEAGGGPRRFASTEGFSTFSRASTFGKEVARLGPGGICGERALQEDDLRAATVQCLEDCDFIVISKSFFKNMMHESLAKSAYLKANLPGLQNVEYKGAERHPLVLFVHQTFPQGHTFLHEGIVATAPAAYVIKAGSVEFRRHRHASESSAHVLARSPLAASTTALGAPRLRQPGSSSAGALELAPAGAEAAKAHSSLGHEADGEVWATLGEGEAFCPLNFFPLSGPEPFTVRVASASGCEVYCVRGPDVQEMPAKLLKAVRKHLMQGLTARLSLLPRPGAGQTGSSSFAAPRSASLSALQPPDTVAMAAAKSSLQSLGLRMGGMHG